MNPDYSKIPYHSREGMKRYIEQGVLPGDFLQAIITNADFMLVVSRADRHARNHLPDFAMFLYLEAPAACWGSVQKMKAWTEMGGLEGRRKAARRVA